MCVDRNRQADPLHTMKFVTVAEWYKQLRTDYPHVVHVDASCTWQKQLLMQSWVESHIGAFGHMWANYNLEYLFRCEHDAIKFSLAWS